MGGAGDNPGIADRLTDVLPPPVERIETHAAIILLSDGQAYKLKKPVAFSFLDFRTLEARRAALDSELRLNRRTAPDLYETVVPVVEGPDGLELDGAGEPIEWLLVMQRFAEGGRLDHVAERGELTPAVLEDLARSIVAFHDGLEPLDAGGATAMREVVDGNALDLRRSVPEVFEDDEVVALIEATTTELDRRAALLDSRRAAGLVRHCHGDLHLENIVLIDDRPVLFDCIEFNDDFARIDLLYDLAFLLMDLIDRGFVTEARLLLQAYDDRREDDDGLALLPFFLSVRAAIRAKVEAFAGDGPRARAYLDLACRSLRPAPPRLVAIGGRSGTGKSSVARRLAPRLGALPGAMLLRSDVIRKRLFGREPTEQLPEEAYDEAVSARVFERLAERAQTLLEAGRTVIADGVFGGPEQRARIEAAAATAKVPFTGFWLAAPEPVLEARVEARTGDASDADLAVVRAQAAMRTGVIDWHSIDASGTVEEVVQRLAAALDDDLTG
jgi:aminoglycoside phosphotransferase family enzyme